MFETAGARIGVKRSDGSKRLFERREKCFVFFGKAHRDAQPLRQAVAADRTYDHALLQQFQIDAIAGGIVMADAHEHEIAVRRHVLEAKLVESLSEAPVTRRIE